MPQRKFFLKILEGRFTASDLAGVMAACPDHPGTFCRIFWFVVYVASLHLLRSGILFFESC